MRYKIEITFSTDQELNKNQLSNLEGHLLLQIDEPYDQNQEPENYTTQNTAYKIERVK